MLVFRSTAVMIQAPSRLLSGLSPRKMKPAPRTWVAHARGWGYHRRRARHRGSTERERKIYWAIFPLWSNTALQASDSSAL